MNHNKENLLGLGLLAAGMIHEIRTPLHMLKERLKILADSNQDAAEECVRLADLCDHALSILKSMQDFSKASINAPLLPCDPHDLVESAHELCRTKFAAENISFHVQAHPEIFRIRAQRTQCLQVLLNLFKNACEAMQGLEKKRLDVFILNAEDQLVIRIQDTGPGVSSEIRQNLMRAFETTKSEQGGTGLGLYLSQQIMQLHGGTLGLLDAEGGACFELSFPKPAKGNT